MNVRGPVVVSASCVSSHLPPCSGSSPYSGSEPAIAPGGVTAPGQAASSAAAAVEFAAGEALRRRVDLRLVFGSETLAAWAPRGADALFREPAGATIDRVVHEVADAYPGLAVTCAVGPGDTTKALAGAAVNASLVVIAAGDDARYHAQLAAVTGLAPVVVVLVPAERERGTAGPAPDQVAEQEIVYLESAYSTS